MPAGVWFDSSFADPVTFACDQISLTQILFDKASGVVSAYFQRGNMPNEAYGQPSALTITLEAVLPNAASVQVEVTVEEMFW